MLSTTPEAQAGGEGVAGRWAPLAAGAAVIVGALLALSGSERFLLFGDEFYSLRRIGEPFGELISRFGSDGSSAALLLPQRLAVAVLGPQPLAFRLPAILAAIGTLLLMYPTGVRLVGRVPAALATLALALNPFHIFYSHFGRSYSLAVFLGLCLVYSMTRATERAEPRPLWYVAVALSAGLLPYAHLTAVAFSAAVAVGGFVSLSLRPPGDRHSWWLLGAVVAGAALCFALYAPAWDPLWEFIGFQSGRGDAVEVLSLDSVTLLAGSRGAALVWLVATPVAAAWLLAKRAGDAVVIIIAVVAMPIGLALARPIADVYAVARYLLIGVPFVLMLLAWLTVAVVDRLGLPRATSALAQWVLGLVLVGTGLVASPLVGADAEDGAFGASYVRLMPLPAFDERWPGESDFYATLAERPGPLRIVEVPALTDQGVALYRNYALRHGHEVLQGVVTGDVPEGTTGGTLRHWSKQAFEADYMIVHLDVASEVERYWRFVYRDVWRPEETPELAGFMAAYREFRTQPAPTATSLLADLLRRFGEPIHTDRDVVVFGLTE